MRSALTRIAAMFVAFAALPAAGCGSSPKTVLRETIVTWAEVADCLLPVQDEASAEAVLKQHTEAFKNKWETLKKRIDGFSKLDKNEKKELVEALVYLGPEAQATRLYVFERISKVKKIRDGLYEKRRAELQREGKFAKKVEEEFPKLSECTTWPKSFAADVTAHLDEEMKRESKEKGTEKAFVRQWRWPEEKK